MKNTLLCIVTSFPTIDCCARLFIFFRSISPLLNCSNPNIFNELLDNFSLYPKISTFGLVPVCVLFYARKRCQTHAGLFPTKIGFRFTSLWEHFMDHAHIRSQFFLMHIYLSNQGHRGGENDRISHVSAASL